MRRYIDQDRPLSLYIHVPFCFSKCDYCAFYSLGSSDWCESELERYFRVIMLQLEGLEKEYDRAYDTIFIGGGNPGMLGKDRLAEILRLAERRGMPREVTVELNPEEVTEELLEALKPLTTRISMGIQSMNPRMLQTLGRNSNREKNLKALNLLSRFDIEYNADIITAIPGFTPEDTIRDIDEIASFGPNHISFYCLCYEEGTPIYRKVGERSEDYEVACLESGWKRLAELGYEHYEISNFARNGHYAEHNRVYWRLGQYIGIGPTAESNLGYSPCCSVRCNDELEKFLKDPVLDFEPLDDTRTMLEYIMVSLRTIWGVDKKMFSERFHEDFDELFRDSISTIPEDEYIDTQLSFSLTEKGYMMLDAIIFRLYSST